MAGGGSRAHGSRISNSTRMARRRRTRRAGTARQSVATCESEGSRDTRSCCSSRRLSPSVHGRAITGAAADSHAGAPIGLGTRIPRRAFGTRAVSRAHLYWLRRHSCQHSWCTEAHRENARSDRAIRGALALLRDEGKKPGVVKRKNTSPGSRGSQPRLCSFAVRPTGRTVSRDRRL